MRRIVSVLLLLLAALAPASAQSKPHYITQPSRPMLRTDSTTGVVVYFDEKAVVWLNAALQQSRVDKLESGFCLHIAERLGSDGYKVDSIAPVLARQGDTTTTTWRQIMFDCKMDGHWAPLHFHVITRAWDAWFIEVGLSQYIGYQCYVGGKDISSWWSQYPFNAMQCGLGTDSIYTYRVKR